MFVCLHVCMFILVLILFRCTHEYFGSFSSFSHPTPSFHRVALVAVMKTGAHHHHSSTTPTPAASPRAGSGANDNKSATPNSSNSGKDLNKSPSPTSGKEGDQAVFTELRPVPTVSAHNGGQSYAPLPSIGQFSSKPEGGSCLFNPTNNAFTNRMLILVRNNPNIHILLPI